MQPCPIIGYETLCVRLLNQMQNPNAGHAYVFVGPASVGKRTAALWLSDQLNQCDTIVIEQENGRDLGGSAIGIETIRNLRDTLSHTSLQGADRRVVIIDPIEAMNESACNALLKILEEPPPGTLFILIATDLLGVFDTIRSRACVVRFPLLGRGSLMRAGWSDPAVLEYAKGRVGKAIEYQVRNTEYTDHSLWDMMVDSSGNNIGEQLLAVESADADGLESIERMLERQIRDQSLSSESIAALYVRLGDCRGSFAHTKASPDLLIV